MPPLMKMATMWLSWMTAVVLLYTFRCVNADWHTLMVYNIHDSVALLPARAWETKPTEPSPYTNLRLEYLMTSVIGDKPYVSTLVFNSTAQPEKVKIEAVTYVNEQMNILEAMVFNTIKATLSSMRTWMNTYNLVNSGTEEAGKVSHDTDAGTIFTYEYLTNVIAGQHGGMAFLWNVDRDPVCFLLASKNTTIPGSTDVRANLLQQQTTFVYPRYPNTDPTANSILEQTMVTTEAGNLLQLGYSITKGVRLYIVRLEFDSWMDRTLTITLTSSDGTVEQWTTGSDESHTIADTTKEFTYLAINAPLDRSVTTTTLTVTSTYFPYEAASHLVIHGYYPATNEQETTTTTATTSTESETMTSNPENNTESATTTSNPENNRESATTTSNPENNRESATTTSNPENNRESATTTSNPENNRESATTTSNPENNRESATTTSNSENNTESSTSAPNTDTTPVAAETRSVTGVNGAGVSPDLTTTNTPDAGADSGDVCVQPCRCRAKWGDGVLESLEPEVYASVLKELVALRAKLLVNKTNLTSFKLKKISATDKRTSAAGVGVVGIVMITSVVVLIVMIDVFSFLKPMHKAISNKRS